MDYTPQEIMVAAAAREIRDGEIVFTGMRLPLIAFALAKLMHAPGAIGLFEVGLVRDTPAPELLYTMGDPPNIAGALWATRMINTMGLLQRGEVDLGFIGGAQMDRFGNLNTSYLGNPDAPGKKLPGSGGAADIASLSKRFVVIMAHDKRRLVERVDYLTSPGFGDGQGWRERVGLRQGGPSAIITTRCVLRFDPSTGEAVLRSYHPGQSIASVRAQTGWDLRAAGDVHETQPPTEEELTIIRRYDPQGFWTR
ncbi:MAG: CoA-transferase [Deltaproteobacteria bacterium]|nr:CoA-transferase [Deltaproteobacteria bacterium]